MKERRRGEPPGLDPVERTAAPAEADHPERLVERTRRRLRDEHGDDREGEAHRERRRPLLERGLLAQRGGHPLEAREPRRRRAQPPQHGLHGADGVLWLGEADRGDDDHVVRRRQHEPRPWAPDEVRAGQRLERQPQRGAQERARHGHRIVRQLEGLGLLAQARAPERERRDEEPGAHRERRDARGRRQPARERRCADSEEHDEVRPAQRPGRRGREGKALGLGRGRSFGGGVGVVHVRRRSISAATRPWR